MNDNWFKRLICKHDWTRNKHLEIVIFYQWTPSKYVGKNIVSCRKCSVSKMIDGHSGY